MAAWFSGELADRTPGMMTLISLAIIVAFATSLAATFGIFEIDVWWELASLITIMVLGHWLEMRAVSQARGALSVLAALLPDTAERVEGATLDPCIACRRRGACAARRPCSCGRHCRRGSCRRRRVHYHGRVKRRAEAAGRQCGWRDGRQRRKPSRPRDGNRGPVRAVRNHAAHRRCAGFRLSHASSRRPCSRRPFLRGGRGRRDHVHLLVVFERYRTCPNQNRQSALPSWLTLAVATSSMIERSSLGTGSACRLCRRP